MPLSDISSKQQRDKQWSDLAQKAQGGDVRAYHQLLKDLMPFIRAVVAPALANEDMVDDLMQNVLMSVHKALPTYAPDRPFKPWLLSIIKFRKADLLRQYYREAQRESVSLDALPDNNALHVTKPHRAGEYKDIEAALNRLSDKQRTVFTMMRIEGFTAKEVALKMDMSVSGVKVSVHRTLQKLKEGGLDG